jgi:hypothetical protein
MIPDNLHTTEYYTGAQVRIYFGQILIDEISSIEWAGNNSKRPVFGYASTQFDAVAQGQYLVQGAFVMPFKEVGFLHHVHSELSNTERYLERVRSAVNEDRPVIGATVNPETSAPRVTIATTTGEGDVDVAQTVTALTPADLVLQEASEGGQSYRQLLDELENRIWEPRSADIDRQLRPDEFDLDPTRRFIQNGFNILVTFGDVSNPNTPSTAKTLIDVHITADQRIADTSDNPIFEQYTFFCRGADESLGAYRSIAVPGIDTAPGSTDASQTGNITPPLRTGFEDIPVPESTEPEPEGFRHISELLGGTTVYPRITLEEAVEELNHLSMPTGPGISKTVFTISATPSDLERQSARLKGTRLPTALIAKREFDGRRVRFVSQANLRGITFVQVDAVDGPSPATGTWIMYSSLHRSTP